MKSQQTQKGLTSALLAEKLFRLERMGRYEEALGELGDIWVDKSALPNVSGFEPRDAAEILLRCGSLFGFLGHIRAISNAQERSRELLDAARIRFLSIYDVEKIAECENHIALSFWRVGEYNEASNYIDEALSHNLTNSNNTRLHSFIIKCLIDLALNRNDEIFERVTKLEEKFLNCGDNCLIGDFYNYSGLANRRQKKFDKALEMYEGAKFYFRKAQHKVYLALTYNNIAFLLTEQGRFGEAVDAIDMAIRLFKQTKDRTREGFAFDSKALIYIQDGSYKAALAAAERGIAILQNSPNAGYLAETTLTKAKVQLYLDDITGATFSLLDAVNIARNNVDEKMAARFIEEYNHILTERITRPEPAAEKDVAKAPSGQLKLILPPSLAHYTDYQGVWINNSHLEKVGLYRGSLAVIVKDEIKTGDLVALADKKTDEISCGFFEKEFGIICLEGSGSEPQLFDENDVVILGRIVGVCNSEKNADGKMIVQAVDPDLAPER